MRLRHPMLKIYQVGTQRGIVRWLAAYSDPEVIRLVKEAQRLSL